MKMMIMFVMMMLMLAMVMMMILKILRMNVLLTSTDDLLLRRINKVHLLLYSFEVCIYL